MLSVICARTKASKIKKNWLSFSFEIKQVTLLDVSVLPHNYSPNPIVSSFVTIVFPYMQILYSSTERGGLSNGETLICDALLPLVSALTPTAHAHILPLEPLIRGQARFHRLFSRPRLPAVTPQHTERDPHDENNTLGGTFLWPLMMIMKIKRIRAHYSHISVTESAAFTSDILALWEADACWNVCGRRGRQCRFKSKVVFIREQNPKGLTGIQV